MSDVRDISDRWCILRCNGQRTLALADSLRADGIEAWTPRAMIAKRKGASRARIDTPVPIMPTFVFARAEHVGELLRIRTLPASPHPAFSIFRHMSRVPLVAEHDIAALRIEEDKAKVAALKRTKRVVPVGSSITVRDGAFAGLTGIVQQSDGRSALVAFGGKFTVSIASWLLPQDSVEDGASIKDIAARAA